MTKVTETKLGECPVEATLGVIGGKWKPLILWHLGKSGVLRFLEWQRLTPGITRKMLTQIYANWNETASLREKCSARCRHMWSTR